jgi:hypothetical protein
MTAVDHVYERKIVVVRRLYAVDPTFRLKVPDDLAKLLMAVVQKNVWADGFSAFSDFSFNRLPPPRLMVCSDHVRATHFTP